jgi:hypothetical protein
VQKIFFIKTIVSLNLFTIGKNNVLAQIKSAKETAVKNRAAAIQKVSKDFDEEIAPNAEKYSARHPNTDTFLPDVHDDLMPVFIYQ